MVKFLREVLISTNSGYFCNVKKESINRKFFGFGIKNDLTAQDMRFAMVIRIAYWAVWS